ncbi:MAG: hypothetical protein HeimC2_14520 [Candidatus Heimdallarchaeota archaeon LC_2]|nr:MAG: hypothetical protein HeimC2_14520 [Candidatus Heimdallarchaeota archaeon LC_2]
MKELVELMRKPKNEYDETYGKELYLNSINNTAILPYKEVIETYPEITNIYLSPMWKEVNIQKLSDELDIPRYHSPGETEYIGVENEVAVIMDNTCGVVMRYLGEFKELEKLIIVRNKVFDNIMEETGKLIKLKKFLYMNNQVVKIRQYSEDAEEIRRENGDDVESKELGIRAIGNLLYLEELELVNIGIKEIPEELSHLQELRTINLSLNEGIDLTNVRGYKNLQHVKMSNIDVEEIPNFVIESKRTLKTLDISNNHSIDIEYVTCLTKLESINLRGIKRINNLHDIMDMSNIKRIYINSDKMKGINHKKIESGELIMQEGKTWAEHVWLEEEYEEEK